MVETLVRAIGVQPNIVWAPMQPGDVERTAADLTKSGAALGFRPRVSFDEGIRRFVEWCRREYASQH